jgi:hypothetical protein
MVMTSWEYTSTGASSILISNYYLQTPICLREAGAGGSHRGAQRQQTHAVRSEGPRRRRRESIFSPRPKFPFCNHMVGADPLEHCLASAVLTGTPIRVKPGRMPTTRIQLSNASTRPSEAWKYRESTVTAWKTVFRPRRKTGAWHRIARCSNSCTQCFQISSN